MSDQIFILRSLSILDDPRVLPLPDALWRAYLELYLHACRVECGIKLAAMEYMDWRMRRHGKNLQYDLRRLEAAGLVTEEGPVTALSGAARRALSGKTGWSCLEINVRTFERWNV